MTPSRQRTGASAQDIVISLHISADQYLGHYRGISKVSATSVDGRSVVLPASALRPFVTREGIHGTFRFSLSVAGKLLGVTRIR